MVGLEQAGNSSEHGGFSDSMLNIPQIRIPIDRSRSASKEKLQAQLDFTGWRRVGGDLTGR